MAGLNFKLTIEISENDVCVGGFEVTVYDHFGDLSVTHWGEEYSCEKLNELKKGLIEQEPPADDFEVGEGN